MHCRTFRNTHTAYVDGLLSKDATSAMHQHIAECGPCARLDMVVRRGLLVARNLPPIRTSPDFMQRLELRLQQSEVPDGRKRSQGIARVAAALIIATTGTTLAIAASRSFRMPEPGASGVFAAVGQAERSMPTRSEPVLTKAMLWAHAPSRDSTGPLLGSVDPQVLALSR